MSETTLKRASAVERLMRNASSHAEADGPEPRDSFQEARARSREAVMLDVRLADGTIESFPYAYLTRVRYTPGDTLLLRFGADEVKAEGRNLTRLREAISEHRARFIQEGTDGEEGLKPEDAAHIGSIEITEGEAA